MADIRQVTEDFAVAPQLAVGDLAELAARGFTLVVNNRPDGEAPDQPPAAAVAQAAREAGLDYVHIPVVGAATPQQVQAMREAVDAAAGPVLAFCRSGTRSITTWARGQIGAGEPRDRLVATAREAGYDLSQSLG